MGRSTGMMDFPREWNTGAVWRWQNAEGKETLLFNEIIF